MKTPIRSTLLMVLAVGCAVPRAKAEGPPQVADPRAVALSFFGPAVDEGKLVGVAVGLIVPGAEPVEIYLGKDDPKTNEPVSGETLFEIASISKTFAGLALADLIVRGETTPQTTLGEALKGDPAPDEKAAPITLERLVTQSSGLKRMPWNFQPADNDNPYADYSRERIRAFLAKPKFDRKIGEGYGYSNIGFGALGLALESISGRDYETLVAERVFAPLGMTHSRVSLDQDGLAALARPHNEKGRAVSRWDLPGPMGACGGVRATLPDMLRFLGAQIDGNMGKDAPLKDALALSQKPIFQVNERLRLAYAWHVIKHTDLGRDMLCHNGETGGFHSFIGFWSGEGIGLVALANTSKDFDELAVKTLRTLAPKLTKPSE